MAKSDRAYPAIVYFLYSLYLISSRKASSKLIELFVLVLGIGVMTQNSLASTLMLAVVGAISFSSSVGATFLQGDLHVTIEGLKNRKGLVCLSLFSHQQGFPEQGDRALKTQCVKASATPVTVTFRNLATGSYAVAAIHDINQDGKLNRNSFGIPTEGFGFSENPVIRIGPPPFQDAAVFVAGPKTNIQINLQYLLGN
jgi:uncharacterized protein (DUF2141 family)